MGSVLRVRFASFFTGVAAASSIALVVLYKDYKVAHESISEKVKLVHESLDSRISALENLKQTEASEHVK